MIKNLIQFLNYGIFAEIALLIFATVFVLIVARTLMIRRELTQQHASIVLDESLPSTESKESR